MRGGCSLVKQKNWILISLSIGLSFGLTGCDALWATVFRQGDSAIQASLPPCASDDCDCGDFISQSLAQQVLDAYSADPYQLDLDGNGVACEALPQTAPPPDPVVPTSASPQLLLGNPSNAAQTNPNNYLIERPQYVLSYSRDRSLANWVSWQVDASWLGRTERQDDFRTDGILPKGFYQATPYDYRGSGYDRGHLVPSADRTANTQDNSATFLMTNIIPQAPENNRGAWRELEEYTRELVYQYDREVYVIAGVYGERDRLKPNIMVPSRLWKVVVVLDQPGAGVNGIQETAQIIAVDMPNQDTVGEDWRRYQTSVDRIEIATGYDLLSNVPESVQRVLEARSSQE